MIPQIEGAEGKILVATARQLGLSVMVPTDCRSLTGSFFAADANAALPPHAAPREDLLLKSAAFIERYRNSPTPAQSAPTDFVPIDGDDDIISGPPPSLPSRLVGLARKVTERPDLFVPDQIRASVLNNLPALRDRWWGLRTSRAAREFDIEELDALPKRFIYYPLQVTPEASINTPAPYYVDQLRAIDALRLAMPPDCALVVKEHWAGIGFRSIDFVRRLRGLPGLLVAKYTMNSRDIIRRASLTCAVTGTAAFEAFLLGRPAIALGPGLSHWALGCGDASGSLRDEIAARIDRPVPDQTVIERVATLLSVRYPFLFVSPYLSGRADAAPWQHAALLRGPARPSGAARRLVRGGRQAARTCVMTTAIAHCKAEPRVTSSNQTEPAVVRSRSGALDRTATFTIGGAGISRATQSTTTKFFRNLQQLAALEGPLASLTKAEACPSWLSAAATVARPIRWAASWRCGFRS